MAELVKRLAAQNPGLMVLTHAAGGAGVGGAWGAGGQSCAGGAVAPGGGGVAGGVGGVRAAAELEAAVRDVEGHALSVTLLGTYLAELCDGNIQHRNQFDFTDILLSPEEQSELLTHKTIIPAKRAAKVIRWYLEQFDKLAGDDGAGPGGPERALLHLLGLFDRPVEGAAVDRLLEAPIPGLTEGLFSATEGKRFLGVFSYSSTRELTPEERAARLREAKSRLRKLQLLVGTDEMDPRGLDAHPMVRAFFAGWLAETKPEAAKAAHEILYRHYAAAAPDLPETLEEMQPLFQAVRHGVLAGRAQETYDEVFFRRIQRGNDQYILHVLGAFGPFLTTIANFFNPPWRAPRRDLRPGDQAWVLAEAAFALTALGRLADSVAPLKAGLEAYIALGDLGNAARAGGALADTLLTLGRVGAAMEVAEAAVANADRSKF